MVERYQRNRERSRRIFDLLADEAYYSQPIALRHPIVFYEGHLPAFSFNTLVKRALGGPSIDARLETLFARGIDPHESAARSGEPTEALWPSRDTVRAFADEADRRVMDALENADLDRPGDPLLDGAEAAFTIVEHEAMHQETLLYMWHRLPFDRKTPPAGYRPNTAGAPPRQEWIEIPPGSATLGVNRGSIDFGWDNEFPACAVPVAPFAIERHDVTNQRFLEFVDAGGYRDPRWWTPQDWAWLQSEGVDHPLFWERLDGVWHWGGDVRPIRTATFLARLCEPGRGVGLRALERRASADRGRVSTGRHTDRRRASAGTRGERPSFRAPTPSSIFRAGIRKLLEAVRAAPARGASRTWSATDGNGPARPSHRSPASVRWPPIPNTPPTSSTAITSS